MLLEQEDINFPLLVEEEVRTRNDGYIDAICSLCEKLNLDPKYVAKHLSSPIKEKIEMEAHGLNLLPNKNKTNSKLPI
jgi:hypothetical protein